MNKIFDAYTLKIIAITGMILQHAAMILEEIIPYALQIPMHIAGGVTFPIMAFFLVEGFRRTSNIKKYLGRLFIFALIAQIPYFWVYQTPWFFPLNVMFLLFLGLLMIHLHETMKIRGLFWVLFVFFLLISLVIEWGFIGLVVILMYKIITNEDKRRFWPTFSLTLINVFMGLLGMGSVALLNALATSPEFSDLFIGLDMEILTVETMALSIFFGLGHLLVIFFLKNYNNERGKNMKYLFYIIYPLHFVVLGLIAFALGLR